MRLVSVLLFLCLLTACRTRLVDAQVRVVRESSSTFEYQGERFSRFVVMVRGVMLEEKSHPEDVRGKTTRRLRWAQFGGERNLQERVREHAGEGGLRSEKLSRLLLRSELESALEKSEQTIPQLPLLLHRERDQKDAAERGRVASGELFFPVGSHAIYTVGCVFPESLGSDPILQDVSLTPEGTLLAEIKRDLPLSQAKWIWEVMPEFGHKRPDGLLFHSDLSTVDGKIWTDQQKDQYLASYYLQSVKGVPKPESPCLVINGRAPEEQISGMDLEVPKGLFPVGSMRSSVDLIPVSGTLEAREAERYALNNLFLGLATSAMFVSVLAPQGVHSTDVIPWFGASTALTTFVFKQMNVVRWIFEKYRDVSSQLKTQSLSTSDDARREFARIVHRNSKEFVKFGNAERRQAIVAVFFSRLLALAQELGEQKFFFTLLRWQTLNGGVLPGKDNGEMQLSRLGLELMQLDVESVELLFPAGPQRERMLALRDEVRQNVLGLMQDYSFEVLLLLQDVLQDLFNHLDFDMGDPEDLLELAGRQNRRDPERWKDAQLAMRRTSLPKALRGWEKVSEVSLFEVFEEFKFTASEVVKPALPVIGDQISQAVRQRTLQGEGEQAIEQAIRSSYLSNYLGIDIDTRSWLLLGDPKYNPYLMSQEAEGFSALNLYISDEAQFDPVTFKRLVEDESNWLSARPDAGPLALGWLQRCAAADTPLACFGPTLVNRQTLARRIQTVVDFFLASYMNVLSVADQSKTDRGGWSQVSGLGKEVMEKCSQLLEGDAFCTSAVLAQYEEIHDRCARYAFRWEKCLPFGEGRTVRRSRQWLQERLQALVDFGFVREWDRLWIAKLQAELE